MYYASLNREVISTLDPVNQVNTNLRNAEDTQRVGAELNIQAVANKNFAGGGDLEKRMLTSFKTNMALLTDIFIAWPPKESGAIHAELETPAKM